jgi:Na+/H+ antiporter NhaD/arsenite permease-like protein
VLLALLATLPRLYRPLWIALLPIADLRPAPAHHRSALPWLVLVALLMLVLFVVGGSLPVPLDPASVALGGAVATLFISYHSGLKPVDELLASIDWATLLYFSAVFVLVGGLERSGALDSLAAQQAQRVGQNVMASSLWLLLVSAALSALIPNIPLAAALPLFEALMLGVVIGGSATVRRLSGKKSTRGAGLSTTYILPHWGD